MATAGLIFRAQEMAPPFLGHEVRSMRLAIVLTCTALVLASITIAFYLNLPALSLLGGHAGAASKDHAKRGGPPPKSVDTRAELVPGERDTLRLPPDVAQTLGIR